jgi:hypothetical protein
MKPQSDLIKRKISLPELPSNQPHSCEWGEWMVNDVSFKVTRLNHGIIEYKKYEKNAQYHLKLVRLTFLDKLRKITFEEKAKCILEDLKAKLCKENEQIRNFKRIEKEVNAI